MASSQASSLLEPQNQSAFPPPVMEYVNKYSDEAVKKGLAPKPPPPVPDTYQMFGQICHQDDVIIRPLETQGINRLHPENYKKKDELKKMVGSVLCNFLDFLDILVKCGLSSGRDEKIEDINLLFIHIHHLINEFRPHQARETLKVMMALQKKKLVDAGEGLSKHMELASEVLKRCSDEIADLMSKHKETDESARQESMDIDDILTSALLSIPRAPGDAGEGANSQFDQSQNSKDMLLCGLLENVKE